ncbi:hypothetical protein CYJ76_11365, partial [Kytococcus schroeteri]
RFGAYTHITRDQANCLACHHALNSSILNILRSPTRHNYLPVEVAHSPLDSTKDTVEMIAAAFPEHLPL